MWRFGLRRSTYLICFTGVDGSGKTTHAILLQEQLKKLGFSCVYVWSAFRPFLSYSFFAITRLLGYWKKTKKNAYTDPLEFAPKSIHSKLSLLWSLFLFVDYQLRVFVKIRVPMLFGKSIICDRYFYDLIMELHTSRSLTSWLPHFLARGLPEPVVTFLMTAPISLNTSRRQFSSAFFSQRYRVLEELSENFDFVNIDSSKDLEQNKERILIEVARRIPEMKSENEYSFHL